MNTIIQYILVSTSCLSLSYLVYRWLFRNDTNFRLLRLYLLLSVFLALLLPLSNYTIYPKISIFQETVAVDNLITQSVPQISNSETDLNNDQASINHPYNWLTITLVVYLLVSLFFLSRLITQLISVTIIYMKSPKEKYGDFTLVHNNYFKSSFSFFKWIFVDSEQKSKNDKDNIITHEAIHASQFHSIDIILIELLVTAMWFNPLIWLMRNSFRLVHEYIADEGTINSGIDIIRYQVLLVNQVAEDKLIVFSSSFNHSLIKKRLVMMSTVKINRKSKSRILVLVPIAAILFSGIACFNGCTSKNEIKNEPQKEIINGPLNDTINEDKIVAYISPANMNVFYRGVKNPVSISVSGLRNKRLQATITKGIIQREGEGWIVLPEMGPEDEIVTVKVSAKISNVDRTLGEMNFRVKDIPDPVAEVSGRSQGVISPDELKKAGGVDVKLHNFDYDTEFTITEFTISAVLSKGFTKTEISKSNKFTEWQLKIISGLRTGQRITFENIKAKGPDGKIRNLNSIVLKII